MQVFAPKLRWKLNRIIPCLFLLVLAGTSIGITAEDEDSTPDRCESVFAKPLLRKEVEQIHFATNARAALLLAPDQLLTTELVKAAEKHLLSRLAATLDAGDVSKSDRDNLAVKIVNTASGIRSELASNEHWSGAIIRGNSDFAVIMTLRDLRKRARFRRALSDSANKLTLNELVRLSREPPQVDESASPYENDYGYRLESTRWWLSDRFQVGLQNLYEESLRQLINPQENSASTHLRLSRNMFHYWLQEGEHGPSYNTLKLLEKAKQVSTYPDVQLEHLLVVALYGSVYGMAEGQFDTYPDAHARAIAKAERSRQIECLIADTVGLYSNVFPSLPEDILQYLDEHIVGLLSLDRFFQDDYFGTEVLEKFLYQGGSPDSFVGSLLHLQRERLATRYSEVNNSDYLMGRLKALTSFCVSGTLSNRAATTKIFAQNDIVAIARLSAELEDHALNLLRPIELASNADKNERSREAAKEELRNLVRSVEEKPHSEPQSSRALPTPALQALKKHWDILLLVGIGAAVWICLQLSFIN